MYYILTPSTKKISFYSCFSQLFRSNKGKRGGIILNITKNKKRARSNTSFVHNGRKSILIDSIFLWEHIYFAIETFARPFWRRAWVTFFPPGVFARTKKPWVLALFLLFGWYVWDISKIYTKIDKNAIYTHKHIHTLSTG